MLERIAVKGEVSNCKYHTSGHIYFTLKDAGGAIACVMFAGNRKGLTFRMKEGDNVVATGSVQVYERDGKYQLYAREITLDGAGALYVKYEQLKKELAEMGMFAPEYKQPIPKYIRTLGVVTAPTGAAVQDIRNIARRRNPTVQLVLYPALVQGEGAAASIVNGIRALEALGVDAMIVGRGGGSIEDLWAFNEEIVARAVFDCMVPVISAVGHETDTTIIDYVADLRAPTPSAAAELAVWQLEEAEGRAAGMQAELIRQMERRLEQGKGRLQELLLRMKQVSPESQLNAKRQYALDLEDRLGLYMERALDSAKHRLAFKKAGGGLCARHGRAGTHRAGIKAGENGNASHPSDAGGGCDHPCGGDRGQEGSVSAGCSRRKIMRMRRSTIWVRTKIWQRVIRCRT